MNAFLKTLEVQRYKAAASTHGLVNVKFDALLVPRNTPEGQDLRTEIIWRQKNWPAAAAAFERSLGDRWYALQLPTHLYHYTPDTIRTVLASAGWQLTRIQWQRNCNNLLWSLEYLATDKAMPRLLRTVRWLRMARSASKLRILLGWMLDLPMLRG